jgi:hypothetical protein
MLGVLASSRDFIRGGGRLAENVQFVAEQAGDKTQAASYYSALLKSTDNGAHSTRPELDHAKTFMASAR